MPGSIEVTYKTEITVVQTLGDTSLLPTARTVTHNQMNTLKTLNGSSTPPASVTSKYRQLLSGGAATIDLTAVLSTNGAIVSALGLKMQAIKVKALEDNANPIAIVPGAVNGYVWTGTTPRIDLAGGQEDCKYLNAKAPVVASGAKTLDLAGTGTQGVDIEIVLG